MTKQGLDFRFFLDYGLNNLCIPLFSESDDTMGGPLPHLSNRRIKLFWEGVVVHSAMNEKPVWDMICLYGAQHRYAVDSSIELDHPLILYSKAMQIVTNAIARKDQEDVIVLLSMILFAFERLVYTLHDTQDGLRHFNGAVSLLTEMRHTGTLGAYTLPVRDDFVEMARNFRSQSSPSQGTRLAETPVPLKLPERFYDSQEAHEWAVRICTLQVSCDCTNSKHWTLSCLAFQIQRRLLDEWTSIAKQYFRIARKCANRLEAQRTFSLLVKSSLAACLMDVSVRMNEPFTESDVST